jgi:hypothetical protein
MPVHVQAAASLRIDGIYQYTQKRWGKSQADKYIKGLLRLLTESPRMVCCPNLYQPILGWLGSSFVTSVILSTGDTCQMGTLVS